VKSKYDQHYYYLRAVHNVKDALNAFKHVNLVLKT